MELLIQFCEFLLLPSHFNEVYAIADFSYSFIAFLQIVQIYPSLHKFPVIGLDFSHENIHNCIIYNMAFFFIIASLIQTLVDMLRKDIFNLILVYV